MVSVINFDGEIFDWRPLVTARSEIDPWETRVTEAEKFQPESYQQDERDTEQNRNDQNKIKNRSWAYTVLV